MKQIFFAHQIETAILLTWNIHFYIAKVVLPRKMSSGVIVMLMCRHYVVWHLRTFSNLSELFACFWLIVFFLNNLHL